MLIGSSSRAGGDEDTIEDFEDNIDTLSIDAGLVGAVTSVAGVLALFADQIGNDVQFDFGGGDTLTVASTSIAALTDDIIVS